MESGNYMCGRDRTACEECGSDEVCGNEGESIRVIRVIRESVLGKST